MTVNVLGVDLEIDIYDVDVFEKFEKEVADVKRKADEPGKGKTNAQVLRRHCAIVKEFFDKALIGFYAQTRNDSINGYFDFGLQDIFNGKGSFCTNNPKANATLEMLCSLCSIKVGDRFGNEDDGFSSFMSGAIDKLQPME